MTRSRGCLLLAMLLTACPAWAQDVLPEPMPPGPMPRPVTGPLSAASTAPERLTESTWYTRADYFHWNERLDGADFVNEDGPLVTLGYTRRIGPERFRIELFGGEVNYDGSGQFDDGTTDPLASKTGFSF